MENSKGLLSIVFSYLGFSVTDGAIRMLIILYFHNLEFSPLQIASLFILYEVAGIFTNFIGGWIATILGLNITLITGMLLQVLAMSLLTVENNYLTGTYIFLLQGLSGVAKDLVKMSSKSSLKVLNQYGKDSELFKWVSLLTGSKNALKGVGFLLGGVFLTRLGFQSAMSYMAVTLFVLTIFTIILTPKNLGKLRAKRSFKSLFSKSFSINVLSLARFFLFGSRDMWFVIGLPCFLQIGLGWSYSYVGAFMAIWVVGYGVTQTLVPKIITVDKLVGSLGSKSMAVWSAGLILFPVSIALLLNKGFDDQLIIIIGLMLYGFVFAVNSILHSYLVLAYSEEHNTSSDVGFYYMANSCGRLTGTILSGFLFQKYGLVACLWFSAIFLLCASLISLMLPQLKAKGHL